MQPRKSRKSRNVVFGEAVNEYLTVLKSREINISRTLEELVENSEDFKRYIKEKSNV